MPTATPAPAAIALTPTSAAAAKSYLTAHLAGSQTVITCHTVLTGTVWFYWWLNGQYQGRTTNPSRVFWLDIPGAQGLVHCVDSLDPALDLDAVGPDIPSPTRTIYWIRSLAENLDHYRIEQQQDGGAWAQIAIVPHDGRVWQYSTETAVLEDLSTYAWRVIPVDTDGNEGSPLALDQEKIVRTPDAPVVTVAYSATTGRVTVS